ncbi:heavy-metal-associated domain-containing protein [Microbacterium gilvum]|uniref:HMA domain-containing protein n=1 Tax=Microbacterium gilvum TaxID=1336204 RepID=A0ABP9A5A0_9MICO
MSIDGRIDLGLSDASAGGCACCAAPSDASADAANAGASSPGAARPESAEVVLVDGMTCGHCVSAVTEELSALPGVAGVDVELNAGGTSRVTVRTAASLDPAAVDAAVAEAGYAVVH